MTLYITPLFLISFLLIHTMSWKQANPQTNCIIHYNTHGLFLFVDFQLRWYFLYQDSHHSKKIKGQPTHRHRPSFSSFYLSTTAATAVFLRPLFFRSTGVSLSLWGSDRIAVTSEVRGESAFLSPLPDSQDDSHPAQPAILRENEGHGLACVGHPGWLLKLNLMSYLQGASHPLKTKFKLRF